MRVEDFDFNLPEELIAQHPSEKRDESRLLILHKNTNEIEHKHFYDIIDYLKPGDVLVRNNSRVIPARLKGVKVPTGAVVELLILKTLDNDICECLCGNAKAIKLGTIINCGDLIHAECIFGKTLSQSDMSTLLSFYDWLRLPLEVILMLLEHCADLSKTSMRYVEKVAISWADEGIDTIDKAKEYLVNSDKRAKINRKYKRMFSIVNRDLSDSEYAHIIQWTESMEMSQQLIKAAYEKTVLTTGGVSFPYMNGILQSWYKKGIKSVEETEAEKPPVRKSSTPAMTKRERKVAETEWHDYDIEKLERAARKKSLED